MAGKYQVDGAGFFFVVAGVFVGEQVAELAQFQPLAGRGQCAELLQPVELVQKGHRFAVFCQQAKAVIEQAQAHGVVQFGEAVDVLVERFYLFVRELVKLLSRYRQELADVLPGVVHTFVMRGAFVLCCQHFLFD